MATLFVQSAGSRVRYIVRSRANKRDLENARNPFGTNILALKLGIGEIKLTQRNLFFRLTRASECLFFPPHTLPGKRAWRASCSFHKSRVIFQPRKCFSGSCMTLLPSAHSACRANIASTTEKTNTKPIMRMSLCSRIFLFPSPPTNTGVFRRHRGLFRFYFFIVILN